MGYWLDAVQTEEKNMVFDFTETESQKLMVKSVKEFCERYLTAEKVREMDDKGHPYPKDIAEG
ncbi:hypothetical protein KAU55_04340, partial [Candidatus Bathyarchaeota archaeon]|nr:hypothetical protein [Candidatus Bathyarchaeota archaeon]